MKISIIGSNGFLSNSIGKFFNKKNIILDIYGRTLPEEVHINEFYNVDLMNENLPLGQIENSDLIIYAVGAGIQSHLKESSNKIFKLNVFQPIRIINELKIKGYKGCFVTFGSYFEIGENEEEICFTEEEVIESTNRVVNDYSISKRLLSRFFCSTELPFRTWHFILPTIYGEDESDYRLIPYTINAIKNNMEIQFTSGDQVRQYIYITDIAEIILNSYVNNLPSGIYNVEGSETLSVKDLVSNLFKIFDKTLEESVFGRAKRMDTGMKILKLDGSKLRKTIDYVPKIKIMDVYDKY